MNQRLNALLMSVVLIVSVHVLAADPPTENKPANAAPTATKPPAPTAAPAAPQPAPPATAAPPAASTTEPSVIPSTQINAGDTAWMLTSTALVLMMTVPGLALFYGGMVRKKNVLATLMQSFAITCLVTILWWAVGYSLALVLSTCWDVRAAVGKPPPNGRGEATIQRRLSNIFYTGDLIPE